MEKTLKEHDNKGGWSNCDISDLVDRVADELDELVIAIISDKGNDSIINECSDVSNFCMMIADLVREKKDE